MTSNKRNKTKCALKGFPKTEKCHLLQETSLAIWLLIYRSWWQVEAILSIFIIPGVRTWLIHKLFWEEIRAFNWLGGGKNWQNFSHLYSSINYRCFHASSSQTHITWLLASWILILYFGLLRGVMKIRFAVTLAVLGKVWTLLSPCAATYQSTELLTTGYTVGKQLSACCW